MDTGQRQEGCRESTTLAAGSVFVVFLRRQGLLRGFLAFPKAFLCCQAFRMGALVEGEKGGCHGFIAIPRDGHVGCVAGDIGAVSYTHLTLPTIYSV